MMLNHTKYSSTVWEKERYYNKERYSQCVLKLHRAGKVLTHRKAD